MLDSEKNAYKNAYKKNLKELLEANESVDCIR